MVTVRNAPEMPAMGLGTYRRRGAEGQAAIEAGIEIGYRHLDTAQDYDTEEQVGAAWQASGLKRDAFFITTKVATPNLGAGDVLPSVNQSLENLRTDQADLILIHWPAPNERVPLDVYVEQIGEVFTRGLARNIGVSNFTIAHIDAAQRILGEIPVLTNQVEVHPYLQNKKLVEHCHNVGVSITCYQPLARGDVASDPLLAEIGAAHDAGADQVALAYLMQRNLCVIPSSARKDRMQRNFDAQKITLTENDMERIARLDRGERHISPAWGPVWD